MGKEKKIVMKGTVSDVKKQFEELKKSIDESIVSVPDKLRDRDRERQVFPKRLQKQFSDLQIEGVYKTQQDLGDKYLEYYHGEIVARDDSSQIIRSWMKGDRFPSDKKIECLAKALQCDADYLLGYAPFPSKEKEEEYHMSKYGLPTEVLHAVRKYFAEEDFKSFTKGAFVSEMYDSFKSEGIVFNPRGFSTSTESKIPNSDGDDIETRVNSSYIEIQRCDHNRDESRYILSDKDCESIINDMADYLNHLILKYGVRLPDDSANYTDDQMAEYCENEREKHS